MKDKALVLLSGGLDSVVLAHYLAKDCGKEVHGLFFDYKQPFRNEERESVNRCVAQLNSEGYDAKIYYEFIPELSPDKDGYNPARNLILLSYALRFAEQYKIGEIYSGFINPNEFAGNYPDADETFTSILNVLFSRFDVKFKSPLLPFCKEEILKLACNYGIDINSTWSCNFPISKQGKLTPCGTCENCTIRRKFSEDFITTAKFDISVEMNLIQRISRIIK